MEYDNVSTDFVVMKNQRAKRTHLARAKLTNREINQSLSSRRQILAKAIRKIAHSKELEQVQQERDEAKEKHQSLLATTAVITVVKGESPRDIALRKENTRLTFALCFKSSLFSKKNPPILTGCNPFSKPAPTTSLSSSKTDASTIISIQENETKVEECTAELERHVQEAKERAEEIEKRYMAVAFFGVRLKGRKEVAQMEREERREGEDIVAAEGDCENEQEGGLERAGFNCSGV